MESLIVDPWMISAVPEAGWRLWAFLVTMSVMGGLILYFGFGSILYYCFYIRRRKDPEAWKLQPKRFCSPKLHRWAIGVAAANMMVGGLLSGTFAYYLFQGGRAALYLQIDDYGWAYTLVSTLIGFILIDGAAYYTHRLFHNKWLFRKFHRWHHRCIAPTPFTTVTLHPVEFLAFQLSAFLPALLFPMWAGSFIAILIYILVFNVMDHSGVIHRHMLPWHATSHYHNDHHIHFHCNYGQILVFFDRFHGTLRRHKRRYGKDVFGGRGAPSEGESAEKLPPFYDYFQK